MTANADLENDWASESEPKADLRTFIKIMHHLGFLHDSANSTTSQELLLFELWKCLTIRGQQALETIRF